MVTVYVQLQIVGFALYGIQNAEAYLLLSSGVYFDKSVNSKALDLSANKYLAFTVSEYFK